MSWEDRLREAAYASPGGTRIVFTFEDVRREWDKKTTGYEFPDADGTFVQDTGHTGRRYPLRCVFWGAECDLEADAFEAVLAERGAGVLEHPLYGPVDVVPFGTITRRDDLVTRANQAVVEVVFWETTGIVYPTAQRDPRSSVLGGLGGFAEAAAEQFEADSLLGGALEQATLRGRFLRTIAGVSDTLDSVSRVQDSVRRRFDTILTSVQTGIDVLITRPFDLALQTIDLIQTPGRAADTISARLSAYRDLAQSILTSAQSRSAPAGSRRSRNEFQSDLLVAQAAVSGSVLSVVHHRFESRPAALRAAEEVLSQFETVVAWRDERYAEEAQIDTGESYQALQETVATAAGFLVEISFGLARERTVILDRARTIIDLAAEFYGSVDDRLDFLIDSNSLTGAEILEIPAGRRILVYE